MKNVNDQQHQRMARASESSADGFEASGQTSHAAAARLLGRAHAQMSAGSVAINSSQVRDLLAAIEALLR
jgi:hypothetical protein